jgi:hypothetical protein
MLLCLKYAFSCLTMIQTFEYIFVLSTLTVATVLPYIHFIKKEYILEFQNKDAALKVSYLLALHTFIDLFTLKAIPLVTKLSIMLFVLSETDFEVKPEEN